MEFIKRAGATISFLKNCSPLFGGKRNIYASWMKCSSKAAASQQFETTTNNLELPEFIREKLEDLQTEIVLSLLTHDDNTIGSFGSSTNSSIDKGNNFTRNLENMARHYFNQGGKLFRPKVSLMMANAMNQHTGNGELISLNQYRISIVSEMIHTASLVHDDVIDKSDIRRGTPTVNALWGNKMAVLVGDYILAKATQILCSIGNPVVISTMAKIIEDLVQGEFMQINSNNSSNKDNAEVRFQHYLMKNFYKTGSLFAHSCKSVAILAGCNEKDQTNAFEYGKSLGLAFQLIDDILDFSATSETLGKPAGNDLKQGLATGPVLYAALKYPELNVLINRKFSQEGDVKKAWEIVMVSDGLEKTRELAERYCLSAVRIARSLPNNFQMSERLADVAINQINRQN
ncbi:Decaprenyl-diphosphate synthase subunit 1 [Strongyloides ratti]|uniref:Decaprenyl-diphosphate synthase subunit 1 n=1 Tax=Strongyloides ratti TaxID=34506 RepID=A0A090LDT2_STRRB|nr:Decaprenyl-diphosphate synthase subunit 1 [Strongyloides ratti]CEF65655.1 Decaprenyl-diphosphate synthase subunit 1 [Strongyloides ratti]